MIKLWNYDIWTGKFLFTDYVGDRLGPCAEYRRGEDDLLGLDLIRKYKLDGKEKIDGVTKVRGSNQVQIAYRLDRGAYLNLPTR